MCALSRSGIYALLTILVSLCNLTFNLFSTMVASVGRIKPQTQKFMNGFCVAYPISLCVVGYAMDSPENNKASVDNGLLNRSEERR